MRGNPRRGEWTRELLRATHVRWCPVVFEASLVLRKGKSPVRAVSGMSETGRKGEWGRKGAWGFRVRGRRCSISDTRTKRN